jgi:tRNA-Thr(GGU) m(6)t(6)A37 methyltransferase TsaA
MDNIVFTPIGVIHTACTCREDTPIQGCFSPNSRGSVEIFPEYRDGLKDLEGFSHLILIYHLHKVEGYQLVTKPFLDKEKKGIFSTRYFARPNPIGISVVKLVKVVENTLEIREVDMLDGTPLLDIKPYVPQFDIKECTRDGWYSNASERAKYQVRE